MKRRQILVLTALTLLLAVTTAYAAAPAAGTPPARPAKQEADKGWRHPAIPPEKQAAFEKVMSEQWQKAAPLRNDLWAKNMELRVLSRNDKTDPDRLVRIIGEMKDLRAKLFDLRQETGARLEKEVGLSGRHAGMFMGGCGGRGEGPGRHWGGCEGGPRGWQEGRGDGPRGGCWGCNDRVPSRDR